MAYKIILPVICFLWFSCPLAAQTDTLASAKRRPPKVALLVGLQDHFSFVELRSLLFGAEIALPNKWHFGVQGHILPVGRVESGSVFELRSGSFDIGLYGERFWNWRLFRARIPFYLGPEIRIGLRKYLDWNGNLSTPAASGYVSYPGRTVKVLARLGLQPKWGNVVLDISLPVGVELERLKRPAPKSSNNFYQYYGEDRGSYPVFLPSISLGHTF